MGDRNHGRSVPGFFEQNPTRVACHTGIMLPVVHPIPLRRVAEPFDDPDWLFELKYDGFRALAYLSDGRCRLVSRNGNEFRSFKSLSEELSSTI
jgi:ATP-dependent DNA ligase